MEKRWLNNGWRYGSIMEVSLLMEERWLSNGG
jgi:hypothetical protein